MRETTYCIGDYILVRTSDDESVIFDMDWNLPNYQKFKAKYFEVIGKMNNEYIIVVPPMINDNFDIDKLISDKYNINKKFVGDYGYLIRHNSIGKRKDPNYYQKALNCNICLDSYPYAEPNYGDVLICWSCRNDPRNKYKVEEYSTIKT